MKPYSRGKVTLLLRNDTFVEVPAFICGCVALHTFEDTAGDAAGGYTFTHIPTGKSLLPTVDAGETNLAIVGAMFPVLVDLAWQLNDIVSQHELSLHEMCTMIMDAIAGIGVRV